MPLPGGVEGLARVQGIEMVPPQDRSRLMVDVIRRLYNQSLETVVPDDRRAIEDYFASLRHASGGSAVPRDEVPLPLGMAMWRRAVFGDRIADDEIAPAILLQRRAACFYHGLASLDDATLAYLDAHPEFVAALFARHAEVLATFGRSIHIRDGRISVPGGAAAERLWESIVERRVTTPELFIDELLGRDAGRLAYFYDAVAHVPEPVRALVLREDDLRGLAGVFAGVSPQWHIVEAPMWRPAVDPAMWLSELRVSMSAGAAGEPRLAAAFTRRVWAAIFGSDDVAGATRAAERIAEDVAKAAKKAAKAAKAGKEIEPSEADLPTSVTWLAERTFLDDQTQQRPRYEMTLWTQRVLAAANASAAPADVARVIAACRGYARFGVLLLTLERMDVRDPGIYADAVIHAAEIGALGGEREQTSLALYQASLAIIERLRLSRRIDADTAAALVGTVARLPLDETEPLEFVRWIDNHLIPAIASAPAPRAGDPTIDIDAQLLDALSGRRPPALPAVVPTASATASPTSNGSASAPGAATPAPASSDGPAPTAAAASAAALPTSNDRASAAAAMAAAPASSGEHASAAAAGIVEWEGQSYRVDIAAAELGRILAVRREQEADGAVSLDAALKALRPREAGKDCCGGKASRQALAAVADALVSMVYAAHLPADRPELLRNAPWRRHDFGLRARAENRRRTLPWLIADELTGGGGVPWHLRGSLLALDLVLAPYHLRRISDEPPLPTINEGDRVAATIGVMLLNPFDASDDDRDRLAATLARGRAAIADRVKASARQPEALLALAQRAGFSEWRLQALRWTLAREAAANGSPADATTAFALIDEFWAGEPDAATIERLDRWGPSIVPITGQFATRLPRPRAWEDFTGRAATGVFVTQIAEIHLRTAAFLHSHALPAALYREAMAAAVQECVDRARMQHFGDWSGFVAYARTLPASRFEDYIAALTVDGPLRTIADDGEEEHP